MIILAFIALVLIFYWLAKVCDEYFVKSLEQITKKLDISEDVSGASFMAIGSSAPELFTAIIALWKVGIENVGTGTIVGSAIFNILVIIGVSAVIKEIFLDKISVIRDLSIYFLSLIILIYTFKDGEITFSESILYIVLYGGYLFILSKWKYWFPSVKEPVTMEYIEKINPEKQYEFSFLGIFDSFNEKGLTYLFPNREKHPESYTRVFLLSIFYIAVLSWGMVELGVFIAHSIGIPEAIIALTILAAGTSVPDMISSIIATKKGYGNMAVSNAIGSNSFDILIGLGLPWAVYILWKGTPVTVGTENLLSSILLLFGTVVFLALVLIGKKFSISKTEGYILIGIYCLYLLFSIIQVMYPHFIENIFSF